MLFYLFLTERECMSRGRSERGRKNTKQAFADVRLDPMKHEIMISAEIERWMLNGLSHPAPHDNVIF